MLVLLVRNGFLSCYKHRAGVQDQRDRRIVAAGNDAAHGGDAAFNASLYEGGICGDDDTFESVYGLGY